MSEPERPDRLTGGGEQGQGHKERDKEKGQGRAGKKRGKERREGERREEEGRGEQRCWARAPGAFEAAGCVPRARGQARSTASSGSMNGPTLLRRNASKRGLQKLLR